MFNQDLHQKQKESPEIKNCDVKAEVTRQVLLFLKKYMWGEKPRGHKIWSAVMFVNVAL